jgi:ELWxxDGT repeat protein
MKQFMRLMMAATLSLFLAACGDEETTPSDPVDHNSTPTHQETTPVDTPVARNLALTLQEDHSVDIRLIENPEKDLYYRIVTQPSHGGVTNQKYTPHANYYGKDSFEYKICNAQKSCSAVATVTLTILNIQNPDLSKSSVLFIADAKHAFEPWITDGVDAMMLKDTNTEPAGSFLSQNMALKVGDRLLFAAETGKYESSLWSSDGTANGTKKIKDIPIHSYQHFVRSHDLLLIPLSNGSLWRSDGTPDGTYVLKSFEAGSWYVELDDDEHIYFVSGGKAWESDGTKESTHVLDIDIDEKIRRVIPVGSKLYIITQDALWVSDKKGTNVTKLIEGHDFYQPIGFKSVNETLFFATFYGQNLWSSQGTPGTTRKILENVSRISSRGTFHDEYYFVAKTDSNGSEMWHSDGTAEGTSMLIDLNPGSGYGLDYGSGFSVVGDAFYFIGSDASRRRVLFESDGTAAGTKRVSSMENKTWSEYMRSDGSGSLYVSQGTNVNVLWRYDMKTGEAIQISESFGRYHPGALAQIGDKMLFRGYDKEHGFELWSTDGSELSATLLKDIQTSTASAAYGAQYQPILQAGRYHLFRTDIGTWSTNGTKEGTQNLMPKPKSFTAISTNFVQYDGKLYFSSNDENKTSGFFVSDGTKSGTRRVTSQHIYPRGLVVCDKHFYFSATGLEGEGTEIWVSDGTDSGTKVLKDIREGQASSMPSNLVALKTRVYFIADDGVNGKEVWVIDGNETKLFFETRTGSESSDPGELTVVGEKLYFTAKRDNSSVRMLWVSDGTHDGTHVVKEIQHDKAYNTIHNLTPYDGKLFFVANDGEHGLEPWISDGTEGGTRMVKDLRPGDYRSHSFSAFSSRFFSCNQHLFFKAFNGQKKNIWVSDGSSKGTQLLAYPAEKLAVGEEILYGCADERLVFASGSKLYSSDGTAKGWRVITDLYPENP